MKKAKRSRGMKKEKRTNKMKSTRVRIWKVAMT